MSATNKTTNYELPVFVGTDKPAWLVSWNGAMNDIDTAIKEAKTAGDNAQTTANTATSDISTLSGSVSTLTTSVSTLSTNVSTNTGAINTINSLIGNGEPTTTDKTIIGAINELAGDISAETASDVTYDNTTSGLTATDVQEAIDELAQAGPAVVQASAVTYDNTTSGLTADDVQEAIDEVVSMIPSAGGTTYSTSEVDTGDVWIDGKHIFRKVLSADGQSIASNTVIDSTLTTSYIDSIIKLDGTFIPDDGSIEKFNMYDGQYGGRLVVTNTGVNLNVTQFRVSKYDVIIEYTKATVTP